MRSIFALGSLALVATACTTPKPVAAPVAPVVAAPVRPAPLPVAPVLDWTERPPAPGTWSYAADGRGSVARFGRLGAGAEFTMRCDPASRRITLARPGALDPGKSARLTLRSTTAAKAYALAPNAAEPGTVATTVDALDPFLDGVAYTRGRFLVQTEGAPDMVLPAWAEVSRVLEDCRG